MKGSAEKIENIKKIAFKMFLETGYEATTVRMICREAGIEPPTLYYFFESKRGLFLALRNDMENEYKELVHNLFSEKSSNSEEMLKRYFKFCIEYALDYENETRFFLRYRLFKPAELLSDINEYIENSDRERQNEYLAYIQEIVEMNKLNFTAEQVYVKFNTFINNNVFNVVFSEWRPENEELEAVWDIFMNVYLNRGVHEIGGGITK